MIYQATAINNKDDIVKKLLFRKATGIIPVILDMRKIEMKQNFPITSGH